MSNSCSNSQSHAPSLIISKINLKKKKNNAGHLLTFAFIIQKNRHSLDQNTFFIPVGIKHPAISLRGPVMNQMIRDTRSDWSASKQWIILRHNGLTDSEFQKTLLILCSLLAFYNLFFAWITVEMKSLQFIGRARNELFYLVALVLPTSRS